MTAFACFGSTIMLADLAYATSRRYRVIEITPMGLFTDLDEFGIGPPPTLTPPRLAFNTLGINDEGMVVGGFLATNGKPHAFLWDASSSTAEPLSAAYAVTNEESATIVGETSLVCPNGLLHYRRPFRVEGYTGSGTAPAMTVLDVNAPRTEGYSRDVTAAASSIDAVGGANGDQADGDRCMVFVLPTSTCPFVALAPVRWEDGTTAGTDLGVFDPMGPTGAQANGINVDRDAVGFGFLFAGEACIERATMWVLSDSSDPIALPDPPGGFSEVGVAEAVSARNEQGCVWVAGADESLGKAALWFGSPDDGPSAFCVAVADDETIPCSAPEFSVYRAHDVNRWGHVAVILARKNTSPTEYAARVLTHVADLDGNLRVDGADLGLLLLNWCSSGCDDELIADLDCDSVVDGADSGILLSVWSGSEFVTIDPLCSCGTEESFTFGAGDFGIESQEAAIQSLGFASMAAFADWSNSATTSQIDAVGQTLVALLIGGAQ